MKRLERAEELLVRVDSWLDRTPHLDTCPLGVRFRGWKPGDILPACDCGLARFAKDVADFIGNDGPED